jgi:hypothetical protein
MKVAVVGRGTSSIITTMRLIMDGHDVDIFYDPDKPHLKVGESTTPAIIGLINSVFNIGVTDLINLGIVSLKAGVKFINWGIGDTFIHGFQPPSGVNLIAFQFDTPKFNEFFHKKLKEERGVNYFPEKVNDYQIDKNSVIVNEKVYDFLIFCSGWNNSEDYESPIFETVNSAITYSVDNIIDPICTLHEATEDGWQFGLPFPSENVTRHGYLFNRNFISSGEVSEKLNLENSNIYEWDPKCSKKLIQNKFVAYNGNKLFFLEPLQALSLHYYSEFASYICEYLKQGKDYRSFIFNNTKYKNEIYNYQLSLAWHYSYGSIHDTKYWNDITDRARTHMKSVPWGKMSCILDNFSIDYLNKNTETFSIGCFKYSDFRMIHSGMTGVSIDNLFNTHIFG